MTFEIPSNAAWYRGSGQAIAAIIGNEVVDAVYSGINVERKHRAEMAAKHPGAKIIAGMLSCYQFAPFDPSEFSE